MITDSALLTRGWGFDLSSITYDKVQIWHGIKDVNAPMNATRYMAAQIPHVELKEYGLDHFEKGAVVEEVLDGLITDDMRRAAGML